MYLKLLLGSGSRSEIQIRIYILCIKIVDCIQIACTYLNYCLDFGFGFLFKPLICLEYIWNPDPDNNFEYIFIRIFKLVSNSYLLDSELYMKYVFKIDAWIRI